MKIRLLLLTLLATAGAFAADPAPDSGPAPTAAETKAVDDLAKLGIDARTIAAGLNWRTALVRLGKEKPDPKIFAGLKDVANLAELDLAGVQLTDADLANIAGLKNLRVLHLEKTPLTDAGLEHVKGLTNLTYLNIYATAVTDAGLAKLKSLTNLKSLYVFETKVTDAGITTLKEALPKANIVRGLSADEIAKITAKPEAKPAEKPPVAAAPAAAPVAAAPVAAAPVAPKPENKAAEAEIAEAQKKLDALNAELAKRTAARGKATFLPPKTPDALPEFTPEYAAAEKLVEDLKPEIAKATAALEAAKAKLK
jgi:hypothetical protein